MAMYCTGMPGACWWRVEGVGLNMYGAETGVVAEGAPLWVGRAESSVLWEGSLVGSSSIRSTFMSV